MLIFTVTPDQYAAAIAGHAGKTAGSSLYPGNNYENLAKFIQQIGDPEEASTSRYRRCDDYFASLVIINEEGLEPAKRFRNVGDFALYQNDAAAGPKPQRPSLLFMRGYPSSEWLKSIGSHYGLDPEFFQRHLKFRSTMGKMDYYPLPSLPSSARNNIQLPITTLGAWGNRAGQRMHEKELEDLRSKCASEMEEYKHNVRLSKGIQTGDSIVRAFAVLDCLNFSLEQCISSSISWSGGVFTSK